MTFPNAIGTLAAYVLGDMLTRQEVVRTGEGTNKESQSF